MEIHGFPEENWGPSHGVYGKHGWGKGLYEWRSCESQNRGWLHAKACHKLDQDPKKCWIDIDLSCPTLPPIKLQDFLLLPIEMHVLGVPNFQRHPFSHHGGHISPRPILLHIPIDSPWKYRFLPSWNGLNLIRETSLEPGGENIIIPPENIYIYIYLPYKFGPWITIQDWPMYHRHSWPFIIPNLVMTGLAHGL